MDCAETEVLVHFCSLRWGAPYEHATMKVRFIYVLQWSKTDRVVADPTARSGMDPLPFPALCQLRCHSLGRPMPGIAAPSLAQLPPHTSPKYRWSLQPAQPWLAVRAWKGEAAGLLSNCIYYSLDCKNGHTNFLNLGGQTHPNLIPQNQKRWVGQEWGIQRASL